jgi:hypothetical protein
MYVKPCPICGRMPKITEGRSFKDGTRRRFIKCPNYCSVITPDRNTFFNQSSMIYIGDGDDNAIYSLWNKRLIKKN